MSDIRDFAPLWGVWEVEGTKLGEGSFGAVWKVKRKDPVLGDIYAAVKHISIPKDEAEYTEFRQAGYFTDTQSAKLYYNSMREELEKRDQGDVFSARISLYTLTHGIFPGGWDSPGAGCARSD